MNAVVKCSISGNAESPTGSHYHSPISSVSDCRPVFSLRVSWGTWTEATLLYNDAAYTSARVQGNSQAKLPPRSTTTIPIRPCLHLVFQSAQPRGNMVGMGKVKVKVWTLAIAPLT